MKHIYILGRKGPAVDDAPQCEPYVCLAHPTVHSCRVHPCEPCYQEAAEEDHGRCRHDHGER
jgi:hypothetical protein